MARPKLSKDKRKPFYVHCGNCAHSWVLFFMPMSVELLDRFKDAACPRCAGTNVLCGKAK